MTGYTVRSAAVDAQTMLQAGDSLPDVWRHCVLQLLDVYESRLRRDGVDVAAATFATSPPSSGDARVDAAFAALAEHLARRDGWQPPVWSQEPWRSTLDWWFVSELPGMHPWALRESPLSFRKRGVFIGERALERV